MSISTYQISETARARAGQWCAYLSTGSGSSRVKITAHAATEEEALRRLERNLARRRQREAQERAPRAGVRISGYLPVWMERHRLRGTLESTLRAYRRTIEVNLLEAGYDPALTEITAADFVQHLRSHDAGDTAKKNTWKYTKALLNDAIAAEVPGLTRNPLSGQVRARSFVTSTATAVSVGDERDLSVRELMAARVIQGTKDPRDPWHHTYPLFMFMALSLRRGELLGLTWDCVQNWEHRNPRTDVEARAFPVTLHVQQQMHRDSETGQFSIRPGTKSGPSRSIPLDARWVNVLEDLWRVKDPDESLVFINPYARRANVPQGRGWTFSAWDRAYRAAVAAHAYEGKTKGTAAFRAHFWRHLAISRWHALGLSEAQIKRLGGHTSDDVHAVYVHVGGEAARGQRTDWLDIPARGDAKRL